MHVELDRLLDPKIDLQALRHASLASTVRRLVYGAIAGEGWPPTFSRVAADAALPPVRSENVYVHLPFCESRCPHCPYTAFVTAPERQSAYAATLDREIRRYLASPEVPEITSLYFGGGSPSLTPETAERVIDRLAPHLAERPEIGIEMHPRHVRAPLLAGLRDAGVTRVSIGVETLDPALLRLLGRRYAPPEALAAIATARDAGFECVDVNLIFGIPGQTARDAETDAIACLELGVDQISAYPLFSFPYTPLGRAIADGKIQPAGDATRLDAQRRVSAACRSRGLVRTSVWSFTRPGVAPYSTVTRDGYVGFGVGAGSSQDGELRFNTFSLDAYLATEPTRPALRLLPSERFRRAHWLYWQIYRTSLDPARYRALFARELDRDFGTILALLPLLGLARRDAAGVWALTERGAVWVHRVQALFSLAYIDELWARAQSEAWPDAVELR